MIESFPICFSVNWFRDFLRECIHICWWRWKL